MKSSKLKKKTKHNQIIFPSTYVGGLKDQDIIDKKQEKRIQRRYHRNYSKDKNAEKDKRSLNSRSLSCNLKNSEEDKIKNHFSNSIGKPREKARNLSVQKRYKRGASSIQISKIYYDNIEKRLAKECQMILKEQHPRDKFQSINIQKLSNNLLRIKQKGRRQEQAKFNSTSVKQSQSDLQTVKNHGSQISILSNAKMNEFMKDFSQYKQKTKKLVSNVDISISGNSIGASQQELFADYRHHNSLLNDLGNSHQSQNSVFKSQVNSTLIETLEKTPIFFFSSKFSIKYTTYFKITSLKIIPNEQEKTFQMQIYFQMYNQVIFKKLSFKPVLQKKNDYRTRKNHQKRMQIIRQKIKQRVLANFTRQYSEDLIIEFYQDLIFYLEHFIVFEKTYRGLVFIDHQQNSLEFKNHERIFQMLKIHKSFYFILKLNYTFYIVKVILSPQLEIKFTFIYDFTTHNNGDQLYFTHPIPQKLKENKNETRTYKVFLKVIGEFVDMVSSEWKCEYATNKQILQKESSAKIAQIATVPLDKWDGSQVNKMANINKQYHLLGDLTNFFVYHNHFDYGFFNQQHHLFINGKYHYLLDEIHNKIPVYVYPHTYIYLQLTTIQKEMIVIPHVSEPKYPKHAKKFINHFFHRQISRDYKKKHDFFTLFINRRQIRMKQKLNLLEIYLHSSSNQRCQKLTVPVNEFPTYCADQQELIDMRKASLHVQRFMKNYRTQKSFLYSKLTKGQSSKLIIYHKGLQKLERQFAFITLYGLPLHQIVEFKIFMFRFGREFIIRFDSIDWIKEVNIKQLIANLLELIKNIYFRKFIQEQARKSKKRMHETLQVFLKKHGKSYVNQIRSKKKLDDQVKRRMMRLANFKENSINTLVYENITTDYFQPSNRRQFLITIRFVPSEQFRQQNQWKSQSIQICVHKQGSMNYFKLVTSMKQLVHSVSQGRLSLEHIDFRQIHNFFKQIRNKIKEIIQSSHRNFDFVISSLKHFLIFNYQPPFHQIYPYKFKLVENIIYETKNTVGSSDQIESQISIEFEMEKQVSFTSNSNLIFSPYLGTEQKQPQISTNFEFVCRKPVNHPYKRFVDQDHIIEIIDIFRKNEDYKLLKEYNLSNREIWITNRETGCRSILSQWDIGFISSISFGQYNSKLFRRLLKSLRPAF